MAKIKKEQNPTRNEDRESGAVIECDEFVILVYPPPREHGKAHCHVRSKLSRKAKGKSKEVFPELKIFLDGSSCIIITEGFSKKDIGIIFDTIFNDPKGEKSSNDEYLENIWEELHNGEC
jgi:hypothetical protein